MSNSKFIMAKKLANVQEKLMNETITDTSPEGLISLIFKACRGENLTFWFNFFENEVVLNLRDTLHENYELNIRQYYEPSHKVAYDTLESSRNVDYDELKKIVLTNTFLITTTSTKLDEASSQKDTSNETHIISGDKPVPKHIREAIDKIQAKGIPVTPEAIRNHLPTSKMSASATIQCNKYLKEMGASQC